MIPTGKPGKSFITYLQFIGSIKRGEKSIIFAQDYVVLSKKAYNALINLNYPELESFSYDDSSMHDWIRRKFIDSENKK